MEKSYYKSPIGILEIISEKNILISLKLVDNIKLLNVRTDFTNNIEQQLDEYFSGKRQKFNIKMKLQGTEFQRIVWNELQKIPYGETRSYSDIAKFIGNKKAQRAVGLACNKNPIMIIVPCHRVISKSCGLGGFAYGNEIKQKLLNFEGCNL